MSKADGDVPDGIPGDELVAGSSVDLDTERAHGARIYDYILGGKNNYAADRAAGDATLQVWPALRIHMQANRSFMHRVARCLAAQKGIRQFLDIGTGIPTSPNFHEVVQAVAPTGVVQIHKWHPDPADAAGINDTDIAMYGGIARKP